MRYIRLSALMIVICIAFGCATTTTTDPFDHTISVFNQSPQVAAFFDDAYGYAVFPSIGKGGFVVGGAFGKGQVYRQGKPTGTSHLVKMSIGAQAGGQAFSEIIFFQDERAYDEFTSGNFEFAATASAVIITAAAQAQAGSAGPAAGASTGPATAAHAPTNYNKGTAVFIHTKGGFMYEATIAGQKFTYQPFK